HPAVVVSCIGLIPCGPKACLFQSLNSKRFASVAISAKPLPVFLPYCIRNAPVPPCPNRPSCPVRQTLKTSDDPSIRPRNELRSNIGRRKPTWPRGRKDNLEEKRVHGTPRGYPPSRFFPSNGHTPGATVHPPPGSRRPRQPIGASRHRS